MATKYNIQCSILLKPVWHQDPPHVRVSGGQERIEYNLYDTRWFDFSWSTDQPTQTVSVELTNKSDSDTVPDLGLDKAVIVEAVKFFNIQDSRFIWAGEYRPCYPEPWASQQTELKPVLTNHNYLGWNGKWTLTFGVPVFTWIHQTQNLGWIYS